MGGDEASEVRRDDGGDDDAEIGGDEESEGRRDDHDDDDDVDIPDLLYPLDPLPDDENRQPAEIPAHVPPGVGEVASSSEEDGTPSNDVEKWEIEPYPLASAGAPLATTNTDLEDYQGHVGTCDGNVYAPFNSRLDWVMARWAKTHGISFNALNELLDDEGLASVIGLSYKNSRELNAFIDRKLPARPHFEQHEVRIAGDIETMHSRNIIECIKTLYGDAAHAPYLIFKPEHHYLRTGANSKQRVYHDMHTGQWWWEVQKALDESKPGGTIVPVLISTDRTQVTLFGNKSAYPVYLTIGNIPKDVRRKPSRHGYILLAYLPTTKLKNLTNKASRRRCLINLFHSCMARILQPLNKAGIRGIIMKDGNGICRRVHPILATYIGDYPEQVLVTGVKSGECPKCDVTRDEIGSIDIPYELRNLKDTHKALAQVNMDAITYRDACANARIKPIYHPFWEQLPYVNIYQAIAPDVLHQLHQGMLKHLLKWLKRAYGATEIDSRCIRLPPNHQIRIFSSGITELSRVTGKEHDLMSRVLLGLIIGMQLPSQLNPARLIRVVRAFLDILFLARLPRQSCLTLQLLDHALQTFHENLSIFQDLDIRTHFNIPKLHSLRHYVSSIKLFGATDNYNSQHTERLHSNLAKDPYRASNARDELPQMTTWLERMEKIQRQDVFIHSLQHRDNIQYIRIPVPSLLPWRQIRLTRHPSARHVSIEDLETLYGATNFRNTFARFVIQKRYPAVRPAQLEREAPCIHLPFTTVSVFHRIKYRQVDQEQESSIADAIHIQPRRRNKKGHIIKGRFDTALVHNGGRDQMGIRALRVAQIRAVFSISRTAMNLLFPQSIYVPEIFAYVEWFSPFRPVPEANHKLFKVVRSLTRNNNRLTSIIPVNNIVQSIHLFPLVAGSISRAWNSQTVLEECSSFLVNSFSDIRTYCLFNELH
ncbi:hypothetical protein F5887DRAFT_899535 [Amanita rubescens]|nr:hypothetical protein F5887DRAFT_899535 [Amanita rubescens]